LFSVRSEEDFYRVYTSSVLAAMSTKWDELKKDLNKVAKNIAPFISIPMGADQDLQLGFDVRSAKQFPDEILQLPERLAKKTDSYPSSASMNFRTSVLSEIHWAFKNSYATFGNNTPQPLTACTEAGAP